MLTQAGILSLKIRFDHVLRIHTFGFSMRFTHCFLLIALFFSATTFADTTWYYQKPGWAGPWGGPWESVEAGCSAATGQRNSVVDENNQCNYQYAVGASCKGTCGAGTAAQTITNLQSATCADDEIYDPNYEECVEQDTTPACGSEDLILAPIELGGETHNVCMVPLELKDDCWTHQGVYGEYQICAEDIDACTKTGGVFTMVPGPDIAICIPEEDFDGEELDRGEGENCNNTDNVATIGTDGNVTCDRLAPPDDDKDTPGSDGGGGDDDEGTGGEEEDDHCQLFPTSPSCNEPPDCRNDPAAEGCENIDCTTSPELPECECTGPDCDEDGVGASGGGTCANKPQCIGDPVGCAIGFQTWKTRCAVEKLLEEGERKVSGDGSCESDYQCEGDAINCAILKEQHLNRCKEIEAFDPDSISTIVEPYHVNTIIHDPTDLTPTLDGVFNQTGAAGQCPAPNSITVAGNQLQIDYQPFCDLADMIRPVVLLIFGLIGFRILMGAF